jgi:hypothetical protein
MPILYDSPSCMQQPLELLLAVSELLQGVLCWIATWHCSQLLLLLCGCQVAQQLYDVLLLLLELPKHTDPLLLRA